MKTYVTGVGGFAGQNQGFFFIGLKDDPKRPKADAIIGQLQQGFAKIPGLIAFLRVPPLINIGQGEGRAQYSMALMDAETANLYKWAPKLEAKLNTLPEITDIDSDLRLNSPRLNVEIDRDRALSLGVTPEAVANTLYDAYGSRRVSTIQTSLDEYDVILEVEPQYQRDPAALNKLYMRSTSGKLVPMAAVTKLVPTVAPLSVNHIGQLPAVNISFNVRPGVALSQATGADRGSRARTRNARHDYVLVPGHGPSIPKLRQRTCCAAGHRRAGDLPGAGHAVRELHPSDHNFERFTVRGIRRASHVWLFGYDLACMLLSASSC